MMLSEATDGSKAHCTEENIDVTINSRVTRQPRTRTPTLPMLYSVSTEPIPKARGEKFERLFSRLINSSRMCKISKDTILTCARKLAVKPA